MIYQILLFVVFTIMHVNAVTFNTKAYAGSTCMHDLESSLPMSFHRGELAEFVTRSVAVHITSHGIRFILPIHHIREAAMVGWHDFPCIQVTDSEGSLCSIVVDTFNNNNNNKVLPCSNDYVAKTTSYQRVIPPSFGEFLESIPESIRGCKDVGEAIGSRMIRVFSNLSSSATTIAQQNNYDLTQCDFHDTDVTALYIPSKSKIYLVHGLQLPGLFV